METVALLVQPEQRWVLSAWEPIDHVGDPGPLGFWDGLVKRLRMHGGWLLLDPACMPCWENLREIVVKLFILFIFFFLNSSPWEVIIFFNLFSLFLLKGNSVYALIRVLFFSSCDISSPTPYPRTLLNENTLESIFFFLVNN